MAARTWDIYCRVIDNLGDAGVCWRLAANLAARGEPVRLVIDEAAPLAFMAPQGQPGVTVFPWPGPADEPGDVVIEAFGCELPPARIEALARRRAPPVWLNVEYLSAEGYVERSHGLPSPQRNGLTKWFYFPGFTPGTGGLLREPGLLEAQAAFDRHAWLAGHGLRLRPGERVVSLFCYENPRIPALLAELAREPTLLLLTPGHAQAQVAARPAGARLRTQALPWLDQPGYDRLLWSSDLNFVRGEDSLVRALWAGAPLVWQIYPQHDGAHAAKLQAWLEWAGASADVAAAWWAWNGLGQRPGIGLPALQGFGLQVASWRQRLLAQGDLTSRLQAFVTGKQNSGC